MFKKLLATFFFMLFALGGLIIQAQGEGMQPADCCFTCTCAHCADLASCSGPILFPSECDMDGANICGNDIDAGQTPCTKFWENNTQGVSSDGQQPSDPNGCIPIDGGLGFLIAGGLGIGVIGIWRRKEELEVECA